MSRSSKALRPGATILAMTICTRAPVLQAASGQPGDIARELAAAPLNESYTALRKLAVGSAGKQTEGYCWSSVFASCVLSMIKDEFRAIQQRPEHIGERRLSLLAVTALFDIADQPRGLSGSGFPGKCG